MSTPASGQCGPPQARPTLSTASFSVCSSPSIPGGEIGDCGPLSAPHAPGQPQQRPLTCTPAFPTQQPHCTVAHHFLGTHPMHQPSACGGQRLAEDGLVWTPPPSALTYTHSALCLRAPWGPLRRVHLSVWGTAPKASFLTLGSARPLMGHRAQPGLSPRELAGTHCPGAQARRCPDKKQALHHLQRQRVLTEGARGQPKVTAWRQVGELQAGRPV